MKNKKDVPKKSLQTELAMVLDCNSITVHHYFTVVIALKYFPNCAITGAGRDRRAAVVKNFPQISLTPFMNIHILIKKSKNKLKGH